MSNGYSPKSILLNNTAQVVGAEKTKIVVSEDAGITAGGSLHLRVDIKATSVTSSTGITARLQHRTHDTWADLTGDNASVAITTNGEVSITQLIERSADQPNMPIKKQVRVVITTGASDAVTISAIKISQPL